MEAFTAKQLEGLKFRRQQPIGNYIPPIKGGKIKWGWERIEFIPYIYQLLKGNHLKFSFTGYVLTVVK